MTPKRHLAINWPLDSNTFWPENLTFHLFFVENIFYIKRSLILAFIFRSPIHSITIYPKCQIKFVSKCLLLKFTEWLWVPPAGFAIWLVKPLELNTRWSTVIWWMEETRLQNISRWFTFMYWFYKLFLFTFIFLFVNYKITKIGFKSSHTLFLMAHFFSCFLCTNLYKVILKTIFKLSEIY